MDKGHDAEAVKFCDLVDSIEKLCKEKEISLAQVESLAKAKEIRPSAVLDELSIMGNVDLDLSQGKVMPLVGGNKKGFRRRSGQRFSVWPSPFWVALQGTFTPQLLVYFSSSISKLPLLLQLKKMSIYYKSPETEGSISADILPTNCLAPSGTGWHSQV